jgi:hypothetical protein
VRTLNGVPQPSGGVCPVGDYDLAVLCKREIRILDLNEGKFKVSRNFIYEDIFMKFLLLLLLLGNAERCHESKNAILWLA